MDFGAGFANVGRVAVKFEPKVLDLGVGKGFEDATVELVACGVGCAGVEVSKYL
jgi:hypothetical protein